MMDARIHPPKVRIEINRTPTSQRDTTHPERPMCHIPGAAADMALSGELNRRGASETAVIPPVCLASGKLCTTLATTDTTISTMTTQPRPYRILAALCSDVDLATAALRSQWASASNTPCQRN